MQHKFPASELSHKYIVDVLKSAFSLLETGILPELKRDVS
jgi:hypothetical protein